MSGEDMLKCLIAFILGWLMSRMMGSRSILPINPVKVTSGKHYIKKAPETRLEHLMRVGDDTKIMYLRNKIGAVKDGNGSYMCLCKSDYGAGSAMRVSSKCPDSTRSSCDWAHSKYSSIYGGSLLMGGNNSIGKILGDSGIDIGIYPPYDKYASVDIDGDKCVIPNVNDETATIDDWKEFASCYNKKVGYKQDK